MNDVIKQALTALAPKVAGGIDGTAKFVIEGEGSIIIDGDSVREGDDDTDVTLTASAETFEGMMNGDVNPTMAFMSGKLKIDGSMSAAMKLASVLG
ncbi:SCP2 sterol-binding domain-containing protein [Pararhodobacter sp.]|uniref:SCP2 sterol-binding domain-containing protein n=1 Tax=Pararhodobacter sp. TaxID=2127056 RepID=UPI002AFE8F39|nr:SCP2 sterol-binding domain-containing protein [Pararhodobacter sp.]